MSTYTEITRATAPSSNVFDFPTVTMTGYKAVEITVAGLTAATDNSVVTLQMYVGGSLITSGHRFAVIGAFNAGTSSSTGTTSGSGIRLGFDNLSNMIGNAAGESFNCILQIDEPLNTTRYKRANYEFFYATANAASTRIAGLGMGIMENTGAIDGFKIITSSNILAGNVRICGMA